MGSASIRTGVSIPPAEEIGLRERKKQRTRRTIERVALDLFARHGFHATTLAQIAHDAEVAPSTLHAYFSAKEDILFSFHDRFCVTARERIVVRPDSERAIDALQSAVSDDVPAFTDD